MLFHDIAKLIRSASVKFPGPPGMPDCGVDSGNRNGRLRFFRNFISDPLILRKTGVLMNPDKLPFAVHVEEKSAPRLVADSPVAYGPAIVIHNRGNIICKSAQICGNQPAGAVKISLFTRICGRNPVPGVRQAGDISTLLQF